MVEWLEQGRRLGSFPIRVESSAPADVAWAMAGPDGRSTTHRALVLVAGVLTLAVLRSVPFVGAWTLFLAVLFGLGSLALWTYRVWMERIPLAPTAS